MTKELSLLGKCISSSLAWEESTSVRRDNVIEWGFRDIYAVENLAILVPNCEHLWSSANLVTWITDSTQRPLRLLFRRSVLISALTIRNLNTFSSPSPRGIFQLRSSLWSVFLWWIAVAHTSSIRYVVSAKQVLRIDGNGFELISHACTDLIHTVLNICHSTSSCAKFRDTSCDTNFRWRLWRHDPECCRGHRSQFVQDKSGATFCFVNLYLCSRGWRHARSCAGIYSWWPFVAVVSTTKSE